METIEIRYRYLESGYYDNYIVYTDSKCNQFGARGGPSADGGIKYPAKGATTAESGSSGVSGDSPFGLIRTDYGVYKKDLFIDYDEAGTDPR